MAKRKTKQTKKSGFPWRVLILLIIGFSIPLAAYTFYLDRLVVSQFEGKKFSLPAKVFARPLELYSQKSVTVKQLEQELGFLNYTRATRVTHPGQYKQTGNAIEIFVRPFTYWDGEQVSRHVRIFFKRGIVNKIVDIDSSESIELLRLDPVTIGGIYPNQGEDRTLVRLQQVPQTLINALIAIEDKRFYQHHGVDPKAILRAITTIIFSKSLQGGSTLTQQLVKNFYLTPERTIRRKVKEMIMAILLELHYSKNEILETYINEVYFAQDRNRAIHGFALASQFYFSRSIEHITLDQAALLVGMLKGPAWYNPRRHPQRAKKRRNTVLKAMLDQSFITRSIFDSASNSKIHVSKMTNRGQSPYPAFMDLVIRQLKRDYKESDLRTEGLRIFTSLNPLTQNAAETSLTSRLAQLEKSRQLPAKHLQGSVVIANVADGEVSAIVGDRNTDFPGFNRALDASRQIGSLIKPAIYLTALSQPEKYHLASPLDDSPFTWSEPGIEDWSPLNYDKKFHGEVPLWLALAKSYNVAAARLGTELGVESVMNMARRLGVDKSLPNYASGLLGTVHLTPYQVAQMYHTIANGGFRTSFRAIRNVTTTDGVPLKRYKLRVTQAIPSTPNYLLVRGLQEVVSNGTASGLKRYLSKNIQAAGKTGTTDNLRDSWFAGFTGNHVAVVWIGNDKNESVKLTGASGALTIWGDIMKQISPTPINMIAPEGIERLGIDKTTGFLSSRNCQNSRALPFDQNSIEDSAQYCGRKKQNKIKSWIKGIFGR